MKFDNSLRNRAQIKHTMYGKAMCRIGREEFTFALTTTYTPLEHLLEFIAFEACVKELAAIEETTIEDLADRVYSLIQGALKPIYLKVELEAWTDVHGDASVTVTS